MARQSVSGALPTSSASAVSTAPKPNVWQRMSRWWFGFEPSLTDQLKARSAALELDASSIDSVDNLFLSVADDPAIDDFLDHFAADSRELIDEVRAAPLEAHVVAVELVARLRREAAENARVTGAPLALEQFLLCALHGPLTRVAIEELLLVNPVELLFFHCHGKTNDDDGFAGEGEGELVLCNDPYTPAEFVRNLLVAAGIANESVDALVLKVHAEGSAVICRGGGETMAALWSVLSTGARESGHPMRLFLQATPTSLATDALPDADSG